MGYIVKGLHNVLRFLNRFDILNSFTIPNALVSREDYLKEYEPMVRDESGIKWYRLFSHFVLRQVLDKLIEQTLLIIEVVFMDHSL